jgi:Flp pilus assembly pilin Flp
MKRFLRDRRGVTLIEFALISPVMLLMLMGLFDLCYQAYAQAILNGAVQAAGRRATLEGNSSTSATASIDASVVSQVRVIANNLKWKSSRQYYSTFGNVRAEPFNDTNRNNQYDPGECFSDTNNNTVWDRDAGRTGQGGANDITLYSINIIYPRLFPLYGLMGLPAEETITARTMLKNQPYGAQSQSAPATIC